MGRMRTKKIGASVLLQVAAFSAAAQTRVPWTQLSPANGPPGRVSHVMAYDAARQNVVLFGGGTISPRVLYTDTWIWDGGNWTRETPADSPHPATPPVMAYDGARGQ